MHAAPLGDSARGLLSSVLALGQQPIRPDAQRQCSVGPAAWQPSRRLTSAPAWAGHGPISGGAALAVGSNPTVARPFRPNKTGLVALPPETLDHSFFFSSSDPGSVAPPPPVASRRRAARPGHRATMAGDPERNSFFSPLPPLSVRSAHRDEHRAAAAVAAGGGVAAPPPAPSPARALTRVGARRWCPEPAHAWRGRALSSAVAPVHPWRRRWCAGRLGVATRAARAGGGIGGCVPLPFSFARVRVWHNFFNFFDLVPSVSFGSNSNAAPFRILSLFSDSHRGDAVLLNPPPQNRV